MATHLYDSMADCMTPDVTIVTAQYGSECVILRDSSLQHHQLRSFWIQLAVSNVGLLSSTLLSTCRHLYEVYQRDKYAALATKYRILCIRAIREAIGVGDCLARDPIVATIIALTLDEVGILLRIMHSSCYCCTPKKLS